MIDLFEKCRKPSLASELKEKGIYPYFHALESRQAPEVIMEGRRRIMLGSFVVFRQIYLYVMANYISNEIVPIALSYPAGWFVCSAATLLYYTHCKFDHYRLVEDV